MTKCKVISRNPINMVVDFNGKLIQLPTDNEVDSHVNISCKNGIYSIETNIAPAKIHKNAEKVIKRDKRNVVEEKPGVTEELENIIE